MKTINRYRLLRVAGICCGLAIGFSSWSQSDSAASEQPAPVKKVKPAKNTFGSIWLIDNQTVMVPIKKSFEMDIMHRFGTVNNGYEDFYGFFAPSNIRLGFNYVPLEKLMIGVSITKANMTWEAYGKYAIIKQTKGQYPVSISYYVDAAIDTRDKDNFAHSSDRLMYFHQLMIARKVSEKLSLQLAPSVSHVNVVNGYYETVKTGSTGPDSVSSVLKGEMNHNHFALAFSGRFKLKPAMAIIFNVDQPLTKHVTDNPRPNLALGLELSTSSHAFQFFLGNYSYITPQRNNFFNQNDYTKGQFLIGFNITRLWNY
ncbi:MAG: DUF5777 family beta-barrel protein [Flavisolibacter sp.]